MKNLTIQFAGYGLQDVTAISGFETSSEMLNTVAKNSKCIKSVPTDVSLFDYETGTMWKIVSGTGKNERLKKYKEQKQEDDRLLKEMYCKMQQALKSNTTQVCTEIRKQIITKIGLCHQRTISLDRLWEILDQIERGEK